MIIYRKAPQLRVTRAAVPEPPFWQATSIAPYSPRRATPIAIDYLALTATGAARLDVNVSANARDELERATERQPLRGPVLVECTELAEQIFRRGDEVLPVCGAHDAPALHLVSTLGALPAANAETIAIAAWPLDFVRLERLFAQAAAANANWGVAIPVMYPVTTDLEALAKLAQLAEAHGAAFFAPLPIELDATAKSALAQSLAMDDEGETYDTLFHADLESIHVATERHIAALAAEIGAADFVVPPRFTRKTNWNGAVLLMLAASRMISMKSDVELAWALARAARTVAQLDKSIERIAEAASLSIVDSLDEASVDILHEWLETGRATFVETVEREWRLRRDSGM